MFERLSYATVLVDDQDAALSFFVDTLEMEQREDHELPDGSRWLSVSPPGAEFPRLAPVEADGSHRRLPDDPETRRDRVGSQVGDYVAFVFSVDDCRAVADRLRERGVALVAEPYETPWGVEASFRDPWGNVYEVVEPAD
jgi:catechol 2,3-dioxygenase-like lactoylglutathione lyase family enzyme